MNETVLILGGTKEAADLARELVATRPGWRVITSLAGRTKEPEPLAGEVRIGGFGGIDGLVGYMREEGVTRLVDATHPFARTISANAHAAAKVTGVPIETRSRPAWEKTEDDNWIEVGSLEEARDAIPAGARVLLALGSQHVACFAPRSDVHFVVRMVDPPATLPPLDDHEIITGRPGAMADDEARLLADKQITHIVCRNSGGSGAYAKIEAARMLKLPVIIVRR